jgi:hypothetical protein
MDCGERGIRTPGTFDSTSDFESGALNQLCHLSFTRRSPLGRRRVYFSLIWCLLGSAKSASSTNAFGQKLSQTHFSNTAQTQMPLNAPKMRSTKPIELVFCLL